MKKIIGVTLAVLLVMTALCSCGGKTTTGTDENGNIKDNNNSVTDDMKDAVDDTVDGMKEDIKDTEDAVDDALTDDKTGDKADKNK